MLSKYVIPGNRIEMQAVERVKNADEAEKKKVYQSQVYDIVSEDRLEIVMPMEKSKLILLPVDAEYDLYFYTQSGLYQCFARVKRKLERYLDNRADDLDIRGVYKSLAGLNKELQNELQTYDDTCD